MGALDRPPARRAADAEVAAILELAREKEPRLYPVLHALLSTGMRRGEALGLQWRDVDWSRRKIHVRRSRVRDRTGTPLRVGRLARST